MFRTLQHLEHIYSTQTLNNDSIVLPMCLSHYQFGSNDYEAYVHHCAQLLMLLQGHAALLQGGIISQISREHISIDSALFGPSSAVTTHRLGIYVTNKDGMEFWDDNLTENEIEIICGVHWCFTAYRCDLLRIRYKPTDNNNVFKVKAHKLHTIHGGQYQLTGTISKPVVWIGVTGHSSMRNGIYCNSETLQKVQKMVFLCQETHGSLNYKVWVLGGYLPNMFQTCLIKYSTLLIHNLFFGWTMSILNECHLCSKWIFSSSANPGDAILGLGVLHSGIVQ